MAKPNVVIELTRLVGSILSADAKVEVVALVAGDSSDQLRQMRDVRITLESNSGFEQVYLERVQGTASCWRPSHPMRNLCPSNRFGPNWSGMTLAALLDHAIGALEPH